MISTLFLLCSIGLSGSVPLPRVSGKTMAFMEDFLLFADMQSGKHFQHSTAFHRTVEALIRQNLRRSGNAVGHGKMVSAARHSTDTTDDEDENLLRAYGVWDPIDAMIRSSPALKRRNPLIVKGAKDVRVELGFLFFKNYPQVWFPSSLEQDPLFCARFNPSYDNWHLLGICTEIGNLNVYNTRRAEFGIVELSTSICFHKNAIFDFAWCPQSDLKVLIASADESISYSDLETGKTLSTFLGHRGSVRALSWCKENPSLFTSVGRDGYLLVWDLRRAERTATIAVRNAHLDSRRRNASPTPICGVFHRCARYVLSAGYAESGIRVWDLRKLRLASRSHCSPSAVWPYSPSRSDGRKRCYGFTSITPDPTDRYVFIPCTDGTIYQYSALRLDPKPINRFVGAAIRTYYVYPAVCPYAPFLVCGSENGETLIWNYKKWNSPMYVMDGHRVDVCSVTWNVYGQVVTCSDDPSWRLWAPCWDKKVVDASVDCCKIRQIKFDSDHTGKANVGAQRPHSNDQTARTDVVGERRGKIDFRNDVPSIVSLLTGRASTSGKRENTPNNSDALRGSSTNLADSSQSTRDSPREERPCSSQSTSDFRPSAPRRRRTSILDYFTKSS